VSTLLKCSVLHVEDICCEAPRHAIPAIHHRVPRDRSFDFGFGWIDGLFAVEVEEPGGVVGVVLLLLLVLARDHRELFNRSLTAGGCLFGGFGLRKYAPSAAR
jgi:hypothetical protein